MQPNSKTNNYSLSTLLTLLGSVGLAFAITILHSLDLGNLSEWLLDLVYGSEAFLLVSQMLSGNGYLFQFVDKITDQTTIFEKVGEQFTRITQKNTENNIAFLNNSGKKSKFVRLITDNVFLGLTFGVASAIGLTVAEVLMHVAIPFGSLGSALSHIVMFVGNLSLCGGLGNRTGRATNHFRISENAFRAKDVNYALSIVAGLLIGITLTAVILGVLGSTIISGGSTVPVILFCASMIGGCASACGYIGRVFDFILGERTIVGAVKDGLKSPETAKPKLTPEPIKKRLTNENILTPIGIGVGIAIGVALIVAGVATLPLFGAGLPKLIAGFMVVTSCMAAGGGTGNRLGYALDRKTWKFWEWFKKPASKDENKDESSQNNAIASNKNPYINAQLTPACAPTTQQAPVDPLKLNSNTKNSCFFKCLPSMPIFKSHKKSEPANGSLYWLKRSISGSDLRKGLGKNVDGEVNVRLMQNSLPTYRKYQKCNTL